jgi:hypothetical protein
MRQCYGVRCGDGSPCDESLPGTMLVNRGLLRAGEVLRPLWPLASVPPPIGILPIATAVRIPIPDNAWRYCCSGYPFSLRVAMGDIRDFEIVV